MSMSKITDLNRIVKKILFDLRRADSKFDVIIEKTWKLELAIEDKAF